MKFEKYICKDCLDKIQYVDAFCSLKYGIPIFVEHEEDEYHTTGTIFRIDDNELLEKWKDGGQYSKRFFKEADYPCIGGENYWYPLTHFVQIQHVRQGEEYQLIHLGTGYKFSQFIFARTDRGIKIPKEILNGLILYFAAPKNSK